MKRSKTALLCAGIAAVLLVGAVAPATADRQTESYSCPQTEEYSCLLTESYSCTETESYPCTRTEEYSCLQTEEYSCTETEYYSCTRQRLVERCVTRSVPYTCKQTRERCELVPSPTGGPDVEHCWDEEYEATCYRDEEDCWDEWETYTTRCSREVDATCEREVTGTCTRQVAATCTREVDATCERDYTGTCERQVDRTCTRTDPHTHSVYCTMPDGASEGGYTSGTMTGNSDHTSTHHDPQHQCSERQARANQWLRDNPVCSCSGCASAGLSGAGDRMSASACTALNTEAYEINNPVCSCSNCEVAGLSGDGTRMSRGACAALNASADQWLQDNPVCSCSGCASAGLSGAGDRMSPDACTALNTEAYEINNPVCSCVDCEAAGLSGDGTRMSAGACTELNASAEQWLRDNPVCSCSGCASAGLTGAGDPMSASACTALNTSAYEINNPVCSCTNCEVAGLSGDGTRMSPGACTALNASADQWLQDNPVCSCSGCASAGLSGAGDRMSPDACTALNTEAYEINNPVCSCVNCEAAELSGDGTRMSRGACTELNASAEQWLRDNPVCSCSGCASAGLTGAGDRMSASACTALNTEAYEINNPVCSCSNCEVAGLSGDGTRMSPGACTALNASADQWLQDNPVCSCSGCASAGLSGAGDRMSPDACTALNTEAYEINNPVCSCVNCEAAELSGDGTRMSRGACTELNASAEQWLRDNPVCSCSGCASAGLAGAGDRISASACTALNTSAYEINNPVCSCTDCEVAGLSGDGTRMSPGACTALNASADQWLLDNPVCSCSGCASAGLSGAGDRMSPDACTALNTEAYEINNPVCSCVNCEAAELSGDGTRMSRGACTELNASADQWLLDNPVCSCSGCASAELSGNGDRMSPSACTALNTEAYEINNPVCSCANCEEAELSGGGTRMSPGVCAALNASADQWLLDNPVCSCSGCASAGLSDADDRMSPDACTALNTEAYEINNPPPATPSAPSATPGNEQVDLSWSAVDGATGYEYRYREAGGSWTDSSTTSTSVTVAGLTNGTRHFFRVRATNEGGDSGWSPPAEATPGPPRPATPGTPSATPGNEQVDLSWSAVDGATGYEYRYREAGGSWTDGSATSMSVIVTGLTNGTRHFFRVRATNEGGDSGWSPPAEATPGPPRPATPGAPSATPGNARVDLSWSAVDGATGYEYRYREAGGSWTDGSATSMSVIVTGLTNGTRHFFRVRATNAGGESGWSAPAEATPLNPVCDCPDCVIADIDGNGDPMTRRQCDDLKEVAAIWIAEHPPCHCPECPAHADPGDGDRMTPQACAELRASAIREACAASGGFLETRSSSASRSRRSDPGPIMQMPICIEDVAPTGPAFLPNRSHKENAPVNFTLPEGSNGNGTLFYSLSPLPTGVKFDSSLRTASGTIDTEKTETLIVTYKIVDNDQNSAPDDIYTVTFRWMITAIPELNALSDKTNDVGDEVNVRMPAAFKGSGTYLIIGTLPSGLSFDASSRRVRGTVKRDPNATYAKVHDLTYRVEDEDGAGDQEEFQWTIYNSSPVLAPVQNMVSPAMVELTKSFPPATGGNPPLTYEIDLTEIPGLEFDAEDLSVTGTPTQPDTSKLYYVVRDVDDDVYRSAFDWTITNSVPQFREHAIIKTVLVEEQVAIGLPEATGGDGELSYSANNVPAWLSIRDGELRGAHRINAINPWDGQVYPYTITYKVEDGDDDRSVSDSDTVTITLSVHEGYRCYDGRPGAHDGYPHLYECAEDDRFGSRTGTCNTDMALGYSASSEHECSDYRTKDRKIYLGHVTDLERVANSLETTTAPLGSGEGDNEVQECRWHRKRDENMGNATKRACDAVIEELEDTWVEFQATGNYPRICGAGRDQATGFRFVHFAQECPL